MNDVQAVHSAMKHILSAAEQWRLTYRTAFECRLAAFLLSFCVTGVVSRSSASR